MSNVLNINNYLIVYCSTTGDKDGVESILKAHKASIDMIKQTTESCLTESPLHLAISQVCFVTCTCFIIHAWIQKFSREGVQRKW